MTFRLNFLPEALEEWRDLDGSTRAQFKRALAKRLANPHVPGARLHADLVGCYKIKLRTLGYRLVYQVHDDEMAVIVIAVDKRDRLAAYKAAVSRLSK
jgi:mRNA interferase RelE/StbE